MVHLTKKYLMRKIDLLIDSGLKKFNSILLNGENKIYMEQQNNLRAKFLKHGFIVLKSVFADSKIKELRDKFIKLSSTDDEILLDENAQDLLLDKDIIKKIKILLNSEKIWYYSDSSIKNYFNPFTAKNGFHNDERFASDEIPYKEEYPIIRAGIYFEDYKNFSGGLKIRDGSHKHFCFNLRAKLENIVRLLKIFTGRSRYDISAIKLGKNKFTARGRRCCNLEFKNTALRCFKKT